MTLPDDDADTFDILIGCVYAQRFNRLMFGINIHADDGKVMNEILWRTAHLYVLADKYGFQDMVLKICKGLFLIAAELHSKCYTPSTHVIEYVYDNTTRSALIRHILVDWFVRGHPWNKSNLTENERKCVASMVDWLHANPDFAVDLAIAEKEYAWSRMKNFNDETWDNYMQKVSKRVV